MDDEDESAPRPRRIGRRLAFLALLAAGAVAFRADRQVQQGFAGGRCRDRVRVYAAPRHVRPGADVDRAGLERELRDLGYHPVTGLPREPGTWSRSPGRIDVFLRPSPHPTGTGRLAERVVLHLEGTRLARIERSRPGAPVDALELEPALLDGVFDEHWAGRERFRLGDAPTHAVDAVLAAEDARFLAHPGFDLGSLVRALRVNIAAGGVRQGGSTITQQVVKNHFLSQERSLGRKLRELAMTLALEARFPKREIVECYLATVYLGNDRLLGVYGLAEGSRVFFGKPVSRLTIGESATLAGIIRAPNQLSPMRHPERARERRDQVIGQMLENGWITPDQAIAARAEALPRPAPRPAPGDAWFARQVRRELEVHGVAPGRLSAGTAVFTTMDRRVQRAAEDAAQRALRRLDPAGRREDLQVAMVALDPRDGAVRALVGGNDYLASQLDRAVQWKRSPGALFKPFVYLLALADPHSGVTAASLLDDGPLVLRVGTEDWSPREADGRFRGAVSLREALADSLHLPAIRVARTVGFERVARFGSLLPLGRDGLPAAPATAIGAFDASLVDVVASWAAFPTLGRVAQPRFVRAVRTGDDREILATRSAVARVANQAPTWVVHALLADGRDVQAGGIPGKGAAGDRDAWWIGYSPSLVAGIRIGAEGDEPLPAGADRAARSAVTQVFERALAGLPTEAIERPPGAEFVEIDGSSRLRAAPSCGPALAEPFVVGTAPRGSCLDRRPPGRGSTRGATRPAATPTAAPPRVDAAAAQRASG